jgi:zinc transport system substrate-binding protein
MAGAMARVYPDRAEGIASRAVALREQFEELDERLRARLAPLRGQTVLAYHPALGYWAKTYGLEQAAVESGGSEPGARHLAALSARMEGQLLRVLVVEPQFAPNRARSVAASLGLGVLVFDPLATDLVAELDALADALLNEAETQR